VLSITPDHHLIDRTTFAQRFQDLPQALHKPGEFDRQAAPGPHSAADDLAAGADAARPHRLSVSPRPVRTRHAPAWAAQQVEPPTKRLGEELADSRKAWAWRPYFLVSATSPATRGIVTAHALARLRGHSLVCYLLENTESIRCASSCRSTVSSTSLAPGLRSSIDLGFRASSSRVRDRIIEWTFERYANHGMELGPAHGLSRG